MVCCVIEWEELNTVLPPGYIRAVTITFSHSVTDIEFIRLDSRPKESAAHHLANGTKLNTLRLSQIDSQLKKSVAR